MNPWASPLYESFLVFLLIVLTVMVVVLACALVVANARERAQDAAYEELETQYKMSQMRVREMERDARRQRCNPA